MQYTAEVALMSAVRSGDHNMTPTGPHPLQIETESQVTEPVLFHRWLHREILSIEVMNRITVVADSFYTF